METRVISDDREGMLAALEAAQGARDDVPVGAVVVLDGRVLSEACNQVVALGDPTAHAEVVALREASGKIGAPRLDGATLYVTMEPCLMCAGAIVQARVSKLVYGCDDPKAGAVRSLYTVLSDARLNHNPRVVAGVLAKECAALVKRFFESLRHGER